MIERDSKRAVSPLVASADAVLLDTTGMSVDDVIERVLRLVRAEIVGLSSCDLGRGVQGLSAVLLVTPWRAGIVPGNV